METKIEKKLKHGMITVMDKQLLVRSDSEILRICFPTDFGWARITIDIADISLDRLNNETYLRTGPMLIGPITDAAAKVLSELTAPDVTH